MHKQYKNILVAVDGSEQSYNAVYEAIETAKRNEAKLTALTVKEVNKYYDEFDMSVVDTSKINAVAESILCQVDKLNTDGVEIQEKEMFGDPKKAILKYAKENEIDIIFIGVTGKGMIDKFFIGSTTQYVVNHATCNVMVVRQYKEGCDEIHGFLCRLEVDNHGRVCASCYICLSFVYINILLYL